MAALVTINEAPLDYAYQGFACIGSGGQLALGELLWSEVDPNDDIDVVLYNAFNAKLHAELNAFVGYDLDAWILRPGEAPIWVDRKILDLLELVSDRATRSPFAHRKEWESLPGWRKPRPVPRDWEKRLKDYVDGVAGKWR